VVCVFAKIKIRLPFSRRDLSRRKSFRYLSMMWEIFLGSECCMSLSTLFSLSSLFNYGEQTINQSIDHSSDKKEDNESNANYNMRLIILLFCMT
jgi:hypothetical protein